MPGLRKAIISLSLKEAAKEKGRYALSVLKSFLSGLHISFGEVEIGITSEPALGVADSGDLEADLPELIVALGEAAKAAGKPVVFLVDELQYLSNQEFSALIMAMHKINQRLLPVILIGAGLPQILGLAGNSKSYAERLFSYPAVGTLKKEDARDAIVAPAHGEGVQFDVNAVEEVMRITECYPYFLQQWGYDAWNIAEGTSITLDDVRQANMKSLAALDEGFFRVRYDRCTPSEKMYMRALAELGRGHHRSSDIAEKLGIKSTSVAPTRSSLIKKGMIYSPSFGDTAFTVPMFDDYMRRTIPKLKKHRLA
ncbi:MAG: ATP-binding protein [Novosphingobium sp.]